MRLTDKTRPGKIKINLYENLRILGDFERRNKYFRTLSLVLENEIDGKNLY
jgi:hypothetical protein